MAERGPLAGVRVLEVGEWVSAPFAARLLGDYGADVLKIERPGGDPARRHGPFAGGTPHPERGALYLALNTSKRSLALDLASTEGQSTFRRLAAEADLIIENLPPGTLAGWGLGYEALAAANPRLVVVSLTSFGQDGPYAHMAATNLTAFAMGGQMAITGDPDREPLKNAGYQADYQLGLNGFTASVIALYGARVTGQGQHVDVSSMECMASVLEQRLKTYAYLGVDHGSRRGRIRSAMIALYECADGYLGIHAMPRNIPHLLDLMEMPGLLQDERFATGAARLQHADELMAVLMGWSLGQEKKATYELAGRMRAPIAYVHTLADLRESPQLAARNFWRDLDHPGAGRLTHPAPFIRMSETPAAITPAPLLNGGDGSWELGDGAGRAEPQPQTPNSQLPLSGVRVLDLTMVWAGPYGTRLLADMGAEVIKIEAGNFYDQIRNLGFLPPETENVWNRSAYFNHLNRNKHGCSLNLAGDEGKRLFLELVKTADVVTENYRAEVMDRLGLGYEALRQVKPDIIMVSMPGHGKDGPERDYVAYGTNIEQLSGLVSLTGYPGDGPQGTGISYGDPMSGIAMAGAVAMALLHRQRTGRGQYVEIAQREALMHVIGEYLVGYSMNGEQPPLLGNRHPYHTPHSVYETKVGSRRSEVGSQEAAAEAEEREHWIAIACTNDEQFRALCEVMGKQELAGDARFRDEASRHQRQDELDGIITEWTRGLNKYEAFARLQAAGVPSGPVLSVPELFTNEHLRARGFFERVTHADAGTWDMEGPVYRLSRTPAHIRINAPRFAEHNHYVYRSLLGLPEDRAAELTAKGVTAEAPDMSVHR